jgi:serpin B
MKPGGTTVVTALAVLAVSLLPVAAGCGGEEAATEGEEKMLSTEDAGAIQASDEDIAALVAGGNTFAFSMYGRLAGRGNLFFSPYSISTALAMTAVGARGETEREMAATLHLPTVTVDGVETEIPKERVAASFRRLQEDLAAEPESRGHELDVANSLWGQEGYPFRESFLRLVNEGFAGDFNVADFAHNAERERLRINTWVEDATHGRIENLIPRGGVDAITTLVLVNAVYFKGQWESRFDEKATSDAIFHGQSGDEIVPMMYRKGEYRYLETEFAQIVEMPYAGEDVSMIVVLPRTETMINLRTLEARLSSAKLDEWSRQMSGKEISVHFPRFELTWGTKDISGDLKALGMETAFDGRADFTGMSDQRDLFIGPVFHKAFVTVNEEGTEAAAATGVVMKRLAVEHTTEFRVDHPFMFVIRDNVTGGILFMGRVVDLD